MPPNIFAGNKLSSVSFKHDRPKAERERARITVSPDKCLTYFFFSIPFRQSSSIRMFKPRAPYILPYVTKVSATVNYLSRLFSCCTKARSLLTACFSRRQPCPTILTLPKAGFAKSALLFISEVFPALLIPERSVLCPFAQERCPRVGFTFRKLCRHIQRKRLPVSPTQLPQTLWAKRTRGESSFCSGFIMTTLPYIEGIQRFVCKTFSVEPPVQTAPLKARGRRRLSIISVATPFKLPVKIYRPVSGQCYSRAVFGHKKRAARRSFLSEHPFYGFDLWQGRQRARMNASKYLPSDVTPQSFASPSTLKPNDL